MLAAGPGNGHVLVRRGIALWVLGRHHEALDDLRRAVRVLRAADDTVWRARALTARALVHLSCGATSRADLDLSRAERLFATTSQEIEVAYIWHNRGLVVFRSGDLPRALSCLDEAERRYSILGVAVPDVSIDRCAVLLSAAAGRRAPSGRCRGARLPRQRRTGHEEGRAAAQRSPGGPGGRAAAGGRGASRGGTADVRRSGPPWWRSHAWLLQLQARYAAGPPSARLLGQAEQVAASLDDLGFRPRPAGAAAGLPDGPRARQAAGRGSALRRRGTVPAPARRRAGPRSGLAGRGTAGRCVG